MTIDANQRKHLQSRIISSPKPSTSSKVHDDVVDTTNTYSTIHSPTPGSKKPMILLTTVRPISLQTEPPSMPGSTTQEENSESSVTTTAAPESTQPSTVSTDSPATVTAAVTPTTESSIKPKTNIPMIRIKPSMMTWTDRPQMNFRDRLSSTSDGGGSDASLLDFKEKDVLRVTDTHLDTGMSKVTDTHFDVNMHEKDEAFPFPRNSRPNCTFEENQVSVRL